MRIVVLSFLLCLTCNMLSAQSLTGTWTGKTMGEPATFIFDAEGYASMGAEGTEMGGKKFMIEGKYYYMKYRLQKEGKIKKLDLIIYDLKTNKEKQRMLCIVEFLSVNRIKICLGMDESSARPLDFKDEESTILLSRK